MLEKLWALVNIDLLFPFLATVNQTGSPYLRGSDPDQVLLLQVLLHVRLQLLAEVQLGVSTNNTSRIGGPE